MQEFFAQLFDGELSVVEGQVLIMLVVIPLIAFGRRRLRILKEKTSQKPETVKDKDDEPELVVKRIPRDTPKT